LDTVKVDPILFGDYWCAGLEDEPRLYDDLQDYEVIKSFFHEVFILNTNNEY